MTQPYAPTGQANPPPVCFEFVTGSTLRVRLYAPSQVVRGGLCLGLGAKI